MAFFSRNEPLADFIPGLPTIAMFGDSLTEYSFYVPDGTGKELADEFKNKANILNFGYAGHTTRSLRKLFHDDILPELKEPPILFTIWLGANDAAFGPQHVPIDQFEVFLKSYVESIVNHPTWNPKPRVLLLTPPPINVGHYAQPKDGDQDDANMDLGPANRQALEEAREKAEQGIGHQTWKSKRAYAERAMAVAKSYPEDAGVAALDVWALLTWSACGALRVEWDEAKLPGSGLPQAKRFPAGYFTDGLHLGSEGYKVVTNALREKVEETWPGLLTSLK